MILVWSNSKEHDFEQIIDGRYNLKALIIASRQQSNAGFLFFRQIQKFVGYSMRQVETLPAYGFLSEKPSGKVGFVEDKQPMPF